MAIILKGNWDYGVALDIHTTTSTLSGYDAEGRPQFDTKRSEMGELLYDFKYKKNADSLNKIIEKIKESIKHLNNFNFIIPVPPSNTSRAYQPVYLLGKALSEEYKIPYLQDAIINKNSIELKSIIDFDARVEILKQSISFNNNYKSIGNSHVLLIDDLFRSGATLSVITDVLKINAKVKSVKVLVLTKTRVKR